MLLENPDVDAAIFEMPRKGLIGFGHPCDAYDVAALLNVADDHIGVDGVDSLDGMVRQKLQVLQRTRQAVVLNIDDPACIDLVERANTLSGEPGNDELLGWMSAPNVKKIWAGSTIESVMIRDHLASGGQAVTVGEFEGLRWMVFADGSDHHRVMKMTDIPSTRQGTVVCNESNALSAAAVAWAQGLSREVIRRGLSSFGASSGHNPGRYNFAKYRGVNMIFDFAHNPHGVCALCEVIQNIPVSGRRRLVSLNIGNRHRSHIDSLASVLIKNFDDLIIGCDLNVVRRSAEWTDSSGTVNEGSPERMLQYFQQALLQAGADSGRLSFEKDPQSALTLGIEQSHAGDLLVVLADPDIVKQFQESLPAADQIMNVWGLN